MIGYTATVLAACAVAIVLWIWQLAAGGRGTNAARAGLCGKIFAAAAAAGAVSCAASCAAFFASASSCPDSEAAQVAIDSFLLFLKTDLPGVLLCAAATAAVSLCGGGLRQIRAALAPLWAILSLAWTRICVVWSDYTVLSPAPYIVWCGVSLAAVMCLGGAVDMLRLAGYLSAGGEAARKREAEIRRQKKEAVREARRKKAELRHPGK